MINFAPQKMKEMRKALCDRYMQLMRRLGSTVTASTLIKCWVELESGYEEKHRHYHGIDHIVHLLLTFDLMRKHAKDPDIVELAIFYHDVVYMPGSRLNEEMSALMLERHAQLLLIPYSATAIAGEYVYRTKEHCGDAEANPDLCLFLDLDLIRLAADPAEFKRDTANIRKEFKKYSDNEFYFGRTKWVRSMLPPEREHVFNTSLMQKRYEARAQANLKQELVRISRIS